MLHDDARLKRVVSTALLNGHNLSEPEAEPPPIDWGDIQRAPSVQIVSPEAWPDVCFVAASQREWLIEGYIPAGTVGMITSQPGVGKSFVQLYEAVCLATGTPFAGLATRQTPVLYLDKENPASEIRERILSGFNLTRTPDLLRIAGTWFDSDVPDPCGPGLRPWIIEHRPLVILDSYIDFSGADDENDSAKNREYLNRLRDLASTGATIRLVHHQNKAGSAPYRGSSIIAAKLDYAYELINLTPGAPIDRVQMRAWKRRIAVRDSLWLQWDSRECCFNRVDLTPSESGAEIMTRIVLQNPGATKKKLLEAGQSAGVAWHRASEFLKSAIEGGQMRTERDGCAIKHFWTGESHV